MYFTQYKQNLKEVGSILWKPALLSATSIPVAQTLVGLLTQDSTTITAAGYLTGIATGYTYFVSQDRKKTQKSIRKE